MPKGLYLTVQEYARNHRVNQMILLSYHSAQRPAPTSRLLILALPGDARLTHQSLYQCLCNLNILYSRHPIRDPNSEPAHVLVGGPQLQATDD